ncbi:MAG: hypothetical protein Q9190_005379, partial [Brigantiaea leucoxantha]
MLLPPTKKRKFDGNDSGSILSTPTAPADKNSSSLQPRQPKQQKIQAFGRISKAGLGVVHQSKKKKKNEEERKCFLEEGPSIRKEPLPTELQDLVVLHTSFLTTLSLHYAHYGFLSPVDLRVLRPNVERAWGKRKVHVEDVRRLLGIQQQALHKDEEGSSRQAQLSLVDYGNQKICIEISDLESATPRRRRLDEEALNNQFTCNLLRQWSDFTSTQKPGGDQLSDFIASLPLAPITACPSLSKTSSLLAKGQRRLQDLKAQAQK